MSGHLRTVPTADPAASSSRPSWREERRADRRAARDEDRADRRASAEERRQDADAVQRRRLADREARDAERHRRAGVRRAARRERWTAVRAAVVEHVPVTALPVVAVSLAMGWGGQVDAAVALRMGAFAAGVPVLTEGMTLTLAGLTAQAIAQRRPYGRLLTYTWAAGVAAGAFNAGGHVVEDPSGAGWYRAAAFAVASLVGLVLWTVGMRSKRAAVDGRSAQELARWRRLRRAHPVLSRRARRIADAAGVDFPDAWARVWEGRQGAAPSEPTIAEIRARRRAAYRRAVAESWTGRRSWERSRATAEASTVDCDPAAYEVVAEAPEGVSEPAPDAGGLYLPARDGSWVRQPVPAADEGASDTVSGPGRAGSARSEDERLETVRALVAEADGNDEDLSRKPSVRAVARRVRCRPTMARHLLTAALAERGITRERQP